MLSFLEAEFSKKKRKKLRKARKSLREFNKFIKTRFFNLILSLSKSSLVSCEVIMTFRVGEWHPKV